MKAIPTLLAALAMLAAAAGPAWADQKDPRLPALFAALAAATTPEQGLRAERRIWSIWIRHRSSRVESLMRLGLHYMGGGALDGALRAFGKAVENDPEFAEGWNKRATVNYLMGDYAASVRDIERTLELEPRHFGAFAGLGLIYRAIGRPASALKAFEKALEIHPQAVASAQHAARLREELRGKEL